MLRLREKEELIRFRKVLNEWKSLMSNGDIEIAEKMRSDIRKANKEITKLDKWRKVESLFYYLSVPTMFIPLVSNVVTVGSAYSRYRINKKHEKYGWIGIGL